MRGILLGISYLFKGLICKVAFSISRRQRVKIGKYPMIAPSSVVTCGKDSNINVGDNLRIDERSQVHILRGGLLSLGNHVALGGDNRIVCHKNISIGDNTILGPNVFIYDHDHVFDLVNGVHRREYETSEVRIGKNCWIAANTIILKGTKIGDNCLIAAGSVVKENVPSWTVYIQKRNMTILPAKENLKNE